MTNKTDKEILEEFERLPTDSAPWQDAAFEIVLKDFLLKDEALAFLKQALSRKEEEIKKKYEYARKETLLVLKELCKDFGDLDWNDDLHLADIIEKHLAKHLYNLKK